MFQPIFGLLKILLNFIHLFFRWVLFGADILAYVIKAMLIKLAGAVVFELLIYCQVSHVFRRDVDEEKDQG